jgi:hypothetical protein
MKNNKHKILFLPVACICFMLVAFNDKPVDETGKKINLRIDNTATVVASFTPNTAGGFSVLSSYLNQRTTDSVQFELLLQQTNTVNWPRELLIGTITNAAFLPRQQQTVIFYLTYNNKWRVRILPNGNCFLKLTDGPPPTGNPVVLPFKVRYKNK